MIANFIRNDVKSTVGIIKLEDKQMKKNTVIIVTAAVVLICFGVYVLTSDRFPKTSRAAIEQAVEGQRFMISEIIDEIKIDSNRILTLYLNGYGELDCAVTHKNLFYYTVDNLAGHVYTTNSAEVLTGVNYRAILHFTGYESGEEYACFGVILDDDVARIEFNNKDMKKIDFRGMHIVYTYGRGNPKSKFTLYDKNNNVLELTK